MYRFFVLFLFFAASFVSAQNSPERFSLKVVTDQEISLHGKYFWEKIQLIGIIDTVCEISNQGDFIFPKLASGKYRICLVSRFNQKIYREISISKNTTIKLKTKKSLKSTSPKNFVSKLKAGDTLFILHNTTGTSVDEIEFRVVKENQKLFILKYFKKQLNMKVELDASSYDFIKKFESELIDRKFKTGCSVIETYTITFKQRYFSVNDNSCSWNGFSSINSRFFSVQE